MLQHHRQRDEQCQESCWDQPGHQQCDPQNGGTRPRAGNRIAENKTDYESSPPERILYRISGDESYIHCGVGWQVAVDGKVEPGHSSEPQQPQAEQRALQNPHSAIVTQSWFYVKSITNKVCPPAIGPHSGGLTPD